MTKQTVTIRPEALLQSWDEALNRPYACRFRGSRDLINWSKE